MKRFAVLVLVLIGGLSVGFGQLTPAQQEYIEKYKEQHNQKQYPEIETFSSPEIYQPGDYQQPKLNTKNIPETALESLPDSQQENPAGSFDSSLKLFSYDIFAGTDEAFTPSVHDLPPDGYTFGPGDHIQVNVWGLVDLELDLTVDSEGKVFIPKVGELVAAGLNLEVFKQKLDKKLAEVYSDYYLAQAGGLTPDGNKSGIRLVRPNGEIYSGRKAQSKKSNWETP